MKKWVALLLVFSFVSEGFACTTFFLNDNGHLYFGRNYDWITGNGMVITNARNLKKVSANDGAKLSWISQYGSITFNQYGKEFPTGGMNEKGLVVELMWLDETKYPGDDSRPALDVLQWAQYQLDNCTTIEEVIATDTKVRITGKDTPLHYLIADASGHVAAIEFLDGKMVVHKGENLEFPVLANSVYSEAVQKTKQAIEEKGNINFPDNSLQRFARACTMVNNFKSSTQNPLDYSFSILDRVSQSNYTKWSIVYDITSREIHFITNENRSRRSVAFADFNLSCSTPSMAIDMNLQGSGKLSKNFTKLDYETNKKLVENSVKQSRSIVPIPDTAVRETIEFYNKPACLQAKNKDIND